MVWTRIFAWKVKSTLQAIGTTADRLAARSPPHGSRVGGSVPILARWDDWRRGPRCLFYCQIPWLVLAVCCDDSATNIGRKNEALEITNISQFGCSMTPTMTRYCSEMNFGIKLQLDRSYLQFEELCKYSQNETYRCHRYVFELVNTYVYMSCDSMIKK